MSSTSLLTTAMRSVLRYSSTNWVLRSPTLIDVMPEMTAPPPNTLASIVVRDAPRLISSLISSSIA